MNNNKNLFGLDIAINQAIGAIKNEVAPLSTILSNLVVLRDSNKFPEKLDEFYFSVPKGVITQTDMKQVKLILENIKKPGYNLKQELSDFLSKGWERKVKDKPKVDTIKPKKVASLKGKSKTKQSKSNRNEVVIPTITIKKKVIGIDR